uniref:Type III secretion protein n=1 Tax=Ascaris lumbricoides TaxID=6252 RepID=A0A0M3ID64_ASCLU
MTRIKQRKLDSSMMDKATNDGSIETEEDRDRRVDRLQTAAILSS